MNSYYNPVHTFLEKGSIGRVPELIQELCPEGGRVLVLAWSETVFELPAIAGLKELPGIALQKRVFLASNPTLEQLFSIYRETADFCPQAVIAVGGGSVMDVGKSLCCLYGKQIPSEDALRTMVQEKAFQTPQAKWIGVPTTAGTGSEVTCWATIWDPSKDAKRSLESQQNYAFAAVADPDLIRQMPLSLAVSSALDAVAHAVESCWARNTNPVSRALALSAVRTIMSQMDSLLAGDRTACDSMSRGSLLAGLAFSNTRTTACHSISYPLTMHYGIPHGTAVSLLLAPVFRLNRENTERPEEILSALGVKDETELEERIHAILRAASIPDSLEAWKVERKDLKTLAALGLTKGRADNNPVELTPECIETILEDIYSAEKRRKEK